MRNVANPVAVAYELDAALLVAVVHESDCGPEPNSLLAVVMSAFEGKGEAVRAVAIAAL
jgi:hypothetical protein